MDVRNLVAIGTLVLGFAGAACNRSTATTSESPRDPAAARAAAEQQERTDEVSRLSQRVAEMNASIQKRTPRWQAEPRPPRRLFAKK